ncbi:MAG: T9SS type A sorting domain-containing protein [Bacteroidetes bacterium]|nr:T9SS type A sorting domain-containing protein [Bacteroidota bacterium]
MKKLILLALFGVFSLSSFAQLTHWKDTVKMLNLDKPAGNLRLYDTIYNNTANPVVITWNKSSDALLTGWTVTGICDGPNGTCYGFNNATHNFTVPANGKAEIDVIMNIAANAVNGCSYVTVQYTEPGVIGAKNMTYEFCTNAAASTRDFENSNVVSVYPNPASDFINLSINDVKVTRINVLNIIGKKVAQFDVNASTPNPIRIPLDNISKGIYLLQFADSNGKLMGVKRVTKQ